MGADVESWFTRGWDPPYGVQIRLIQQPPYMVAIKSTCVLNCAASKTEPKGKIAVC
jgi:hypothetical protein